MFESRSKEKTAVGSAIVLLLILSPPVPAQTAQTVQLSEGPLEIPTYALGTEDRNPAFPLVRGHDIYPYTMLDDLTDQRESKSYHAVFLENEYLKVIVLPELGGRVYSVYDKVGGREIFYRNNVVKYGLVALRGAWISGGIEFNFPDGHTVVSVSPVSWTKRQGLDGSATVVVGDIDEVTNMHWEVALTLRPLEARLQQRVTLFNSTAATNRYWFWANAAVPATDDMRFIYPMREAYPHQPFAVPYPMWNGVDYSWYKNIRQPTSLFGRQVHRDFFGAYYEKGDYGLVHVADFRQDPGKKIWSWGVADDGLIWTNILSDHDGPYNEIQSGRYETQLNYEFMPPRRVERWTEYWYPVGRLGGGLVDATNDFALNERFLPHTASGEPQFEIAISPVVVIPGVKVRLQSGSRLVREFGPVALQPLQSVVFDVPVSELQTDPKAAPDAHLAIEVESSKGPVLARWSSDDPVDGNRDFVPAAGARRGPEKSITKTAVKMTVEELFLHGVDQEKHGDDEAAQTTYEEALSHDPGYVPALLKQAWRRYRSDDFPGAENLIARALARNPFDPDVHYVAGVVYRASERWTLSQDAFWASIHYGGPTAPALAQLGEISIHERHYARAADLLRQALSYNPDDGVAMADLGVALRLEGGRYLDALRVMKEAEQKMVLLPYVRAERWRQASGGTAETRAQQSKSSAPLFPGNNVQNYLEAAAWYRDLADLPSADAVLQAAIKELPAGAVSPLIYYYLASDAWVEGDSKAGDAFAAKGAAASCEKVFPHRLQDARALADVIAHGRPDPAAQYELGNFVFAHGRYNDAERLWLQALGGGLDLSVLERNLGVYAWRVRKNLREAADYYAKAIQLAPDDYRLYLDLDDIDTHMGDVEQRAKLFAAAPASVLDRDTVRLRRARLAVDQKQYQKALALLAGHNFKPWEGGQIVRQVYVRASLEEGRRLLTAKNSPGATASFRQATEYPANLGVGKPDKPHDEEAYYWLGMALEGSGARADARVAWQEAVREGKDATGDGARFAKLASARLTPRKASTPP
jgi:tetratricopeptide (TPR) repeat protein